MKTALIGLLVLVFGMAQAMEVEREQALQEAYKVNGQDLVFGKRSAKKTVVMFSDLQCQFCHLGFDSIEDIQASGDADIKIVYRNLPLDFHAEAKEAALVLQAIAATNSKLSKKFIKFLHKNQDELAADFDGLVQKFAQMNKLDVKKLIELAHSKKMTDKVESDMRLAKQLGIRGTPAFIIGEEVVMGAYPRETLLEKILEQ